MTGIATGALLLDEAAGVGAGGGLGFFTLSANATLEVPDDGNVESEDATTPGMCDIAFDSCSDFTTTGTVVAGLEAMVLAREAMTGLMWAVDLEGVFCELATLEIGSTTETTSVPVSFSEFRPSLLMGAQAYSPIHNAYIILKYQRKRMGAWAGL